MRYGARLLTPALLGLLLGPPTTARLVERIESAAGRPLPALTAPAAPAAPLVWVPDRWVPVPGAPGGVHVPGHWELRLGEREFHVPAAVVPRPDGTLLMIPDGVRGPAESRGAP